MFGDVVIANVILDRLVDHSTIIKITGKSYRIKDKFVNCEANDEEKGDE